MLCAFNKLVIAALYLSEVYTNANINIYFYDTAECLILAEVHISYWTLGGKQINQI